MDGVTQILPPDAGRARTYGGKNFTEVKTLLSDGSVIEGIPVVITGSAGGGLTDAELRATPVAVTGAVEVSNLPSSQQVEGEVSVSNMIPAVETGLAKDGTDITEPTAMPAGGVGIRGWLSAIWTKLNGTLGISGTVSVSNPTANPETGLATSAKQDTLLTELQRKADLTEVQPTFDEGNNILLREMLEQLNIPLWYDPATNSLKAVVTGAVTATMTSTTLTNITNIGSIPTDPLVPAAINQSWILGVRHLLT